MQKVAGEVVVNGATDAAAQGLDVGAEVRDRYDPRQTLQAAALGGIIGGGLHFADAGFRAAPDFTARAVRAAGGAVDFSRRAATDAAGRLGSSPALTPVPDLFSGPAMDAGRVEQRTRLRPVERVTIPPSLRPSFENAARESGVPIDYLGSLASRESSFNPTADAPTSSARGLFQFTEGTWLGTLRRHGARLGVPDVEARIAADPAAVLALRDDPDLSARAVALFTQDNAEALRRVLGREPTQAELYSAHFLGERDARRLATAEDGARAADLFPDAARANRSIFYAEGRPRSVAEVRAELGRHFGGGGVGAPDPVRSTPEVSPFVAETLRREPLTPEALGVDPAPDASARQPRRSEVFARLPDQVEEDAPVAMRLGLGGDEGQAPWLRSSEGPDGFRVYDVGRFTDTPMLWANRVGRDLRIESTALPPDMRSRGRGVEIYERALDAASDQGGRLVSDSIVSGDAARIYDALERRGHAVTRDPTARFNGRGWEAPEGRPVYTVRRGKPASPASGPDFSGRATAAPDFASRATAQSKLASGGQATGGLKGAPRPDAVARGAGAQFQGKTVSALANDLRAALGITHRQGRVGLRGALGTYDRGSGVVRTKAVQELDVLAHEATHALEFERKGQALDDAMRAHAQELRALDYDPSKARRHEGFAEFGRWYFTNPDHARRVAPGFYDAFEKALQADDPATFAKLKAVQDGYQNLLQSSSLDVAKASIAYTGDRGPIGNLREAIQRRGPGSVVREGMDKIYTAIVDDLHPIAVAERELGKLYLSNFGRKLELKRAASPYALSRLTRDVYAAGFNDLMNGVTPSLLLERCEEAASVEPLGVVRHGQASVRKMAAPTISAAAPATARATAPSWASRGSGRCGARSARVSAA